MSNQLLSLANKDCQVYIFIRAKIGIFSVSRKQSEGEECDMSHSDKYLVQEWK